MVITRLRLLVICVYISVYLSSKIDEYKCPGTFIRTEDFEKIPRTGVLGAPVVEMGPCSTCVSVKSSWKLDSTHEVLEMSVDVSQFSHNISLRHLRAYYSNHNPFAVALIAPAMRYRFSLQLEGYIDCDFAQHMDDLQRILHYGTARPFEGNDRQYKRVHIDYNASTLNSRRRKSYGVASCFTGGVDATATAFSWLQDLDYLLMASGVDVSDSNEKSFVVSTNNARSVANKLGKKLVIVRTNIKRAVFDVLEGHGAHWNWFHGGVIASTAHFISPWVRLLIISSSFSYPSLFSDGRFFAWGTSPLTTPLYSTSQIYLKPDMDDLSRIEKIEYILKHPARDIFFDHARVCHQTYHNFVGEGEHLNCGMCTKCNRTMTAIAAFGGQEFLDKAKTFPAQRRRNFIQNFVYSDNELEQAYLPNFIDYCENRQKKEFRTEVCQKLINHNQDLT